MTREQEIEFYIRCIENCTKGMREIWTGQESPSDKKRYVKTIIKEIELYQAKLNNAL